MSAAAAAGCMWDWEGWMLPLASSMHFKPRQHGLPIKGHAVCLPRSRAKPWVGVGLLQGGGALQPAHRPVHMPLAECCFPTCCCRRRLWGWHPRWRRCQRCCWMPRRARPPPCLCCASRCAALPLWRRLRSWVSMGNQISIPHQYSTGISGQGGQLLLCICCQSKPFFCRSYCCHHMLRPPLCSGQNSIWLSCCSVPLDAFFCRRLRTPLPAWVRCRVSPAGHRPPLLVGGGQL